MSSGRIVLVGGGPAAVAAATALRERGHEGDVLLLGDEEALPYERPPLSKQFLTGPDVELTELRAAQWYRERDVTVRTGARVVALDPGAHEVELSGGERIGYSAVLLATGVRARPGVTRRDDRVLSLRSVADARRLRERMATCERIVVLGGGFIGCEVVSTAVRQGKQVTVIERTSVLMERALGTDLGRVLTDVHRGEGVDVWLGAVVLDCVARADAVEVRTDRGSVDADLVVVGAGCDPNDELAVAAGLATANGVVTDEFCRTSAPDVYAAGDVASSWHPAYEEHVRVEHHDSAQRQGAAAAGAMLGDATPYAEPHWFWSDQYEHNIQQVGRSKPTDRMVLRGSLDDLAFSAVWLRDGRITKIIAVNWPRDVLAVRKVLFTEHEVRPEEVADPDSDLRRLTRSHRAA